nr:hypothetical protein Iba_chr15bCG9590 [Ipomoea batatas]
MCKRDLLPREENKDVLRDKNKGDRSCPRRQGSEVVDADAHEADVDEEEEDLEDLSLLQAKRLQFAWKET